MSVGFRDWLARKMMQELVKVKQNQANIVKHLLGSVASQGLAYFTELERLNREDIARNMERMRQAHVRNDYRVSGHTSGYPADQGPQVDSVYAKVTNVNNNANIPADNPTGTPSKVPVYRIRSLPQTGEDDTIMITTPTAGLPTGSLEVQQTSRSPRSPKPRSPRQHAPLPPVPDEDIDSVYSLAQAMPPVKPPPYIQHSSSSRQNAPLPPPPSIGQVSSAHFKTERVNIVNNDSISELEYDGEAEDVFDDVSSKTAPSEKWQQTTSHPPSPLARQSGTSQQPETRKNSPLPPLPPPSLTESPDANKQTMFTKHVDSGTAACTNRAAPKQQMLTGAPAQPSKQSLDVNKLSVAPHPRRSQSRSPSPPSPAVPCRSPGGTKWKPTPSPPPSQVLEKVHASSSSSEMPEPTIRHSSHRPLVSTRGTKCYSMSQIPSSAIGNGEDAPPTPPPRKISAPVESSRPPVGEESVNNVPGMPPVPLRKMSGEKPNVDPEAPPLPSRKIIDNSESSAAPHLLVHKIPDTGEPTAPPLPSREVIIDQGGSPGKRSTRRNASRTKSSESLTSLPEEEEKESHSLFTGLGEGIFSRFAMQRRLHGLLHAPTRNRASSNQFNSHAKPKARVGKRLSDPSSQTETNNSRVPIHKTPLPPIPVQMHTSASAPQMLLEDVPQDVYEDLDKACELVNQDVPQFDYEDLDMQTDKPQDHYEDIDYETEDTPQEVYEDINNEAAQRVSFAIDGTHVPQDYTPPIVRRSVAYPEEDEPQDYTPPIRRGGVHVELDEPQDYEPQDYTPPIRRNRVYVDDDGEEPQEYTSPVVRRSVVVDSQSMSGPPLPPRSVLREQHDRRRGRRAETPPMSPALTKVQPDPQHRLSSSSHGQQTARESQPPPPPISPPTKGRARSRSPVPPPVSRPHPEAPPPKAPTNVGVVPTPPPAPPMGGDTPPPPPPPAIGHKAPPPVSSPVHSRETSADLSQEVDDDPPSELLSGIRNVQLKKATERKPPPQKPPPSGSSTASLFAEMQSFQLKKTKRPNNNVNTESDTKPSQADDGGGNGSQSTRTVPFHAALRPTRSAVQSPVSPPKPAPRTKPPAPVRPKPYKIPPPAIKPKPAHLLPPKQSTVTAHTSPNSPVHSNGRVMLKSHDRLGVPATS